MAPRANYENEWIVATKLAGIVGEKVLAHAYYDGQFSSLKTAVGAGWDDFAEHVEGIADTATGPTHWNWLVTHGYA
jgi:hypothetical protein